MKHISLALIFIFLLSCQSNSPHFDDIEVSWELLTNGYEEKVQCRSAFTFVNRGNTPFTHEGWAMYFNHATRMPMAESMPPEVRIEHLNGDFYRLSPTDKFHLAPKDTLRVEFNSEAFFSKDTDAPIGVYFGKLDGSGKVVSTHVVKDFQVAPFVRPEQINRMPGDNTPIPTPAWQYAFNQNMSQVAEEELLPILPPPVRFQKKVGNLPLDGNYTIQYGPGLESEANFLAESLNSLTGHSFSTNEGESESPKTIRLLNDSQLVPEKEGYRLTISPEEGIDIKGNDAAGVFYGIQSLLALAPVAAFQEASKTLVFGAVDMYDYPRFGYRGLHLDVGRNFHSIATVKKYLDIAAFYKLNVMQILLSEDEGWRIEIPGLPELTEIGGRRGHAMPEDAALHPAYGSGPVGDPAVSHGSGYYSREAYIDLIKYAHERHIQLIPTINFPGHARAAIKSMEARYHRLVAAGDKEGAEEYLLSDFADESEYLSAQHYRDNVACVCRESLYTFNEKVIDEIALMYEEAGVGMPIFHTGGDEVPKGPWEKSPICQEFMRNHPEIKEAKYLNDYYHRRVIDYLAQKGIQMAGWEEIVLWRNDDGTQSINPEFIPQKPLTYVWNNLWDAKDLGHRLANAGYPLILCNVSNFYFDLAYNKDPREPGLYWGGYVNTRSSFEFHPYNVFLSTKSDNMGNSMDPDKDFEGLETLKPENRSNIIGLQAQLWSESIKGPEMLESYYLPKLLGFARSAWAAAAEWESQQDHDKRNAVIDHEWNRYANSIARKEFPRLNHQFGGFNYRIAPPGAVIEAGMLKANTEFPGLIIRYTTDGTEPTADSPEYTGPVPVSGSAKVRTF